MPEFRSVAQLRMLQSLSTKLNRLNDISEIGEAITAELRSLIDYHNCRIYVLDNVNDHVEHFALTTRPEVHHLIASLLDGSVTNQTQVAAIFQSPGTVTELL